MRLFSSRIWACVMSPFSLIYGLIMAVRNALYDQNWLRVHRLSVPVISVGNLTAGGAGKTPLTLYLAKMLIQKRARPGIVSRGYGRASKGFVLVSDGKRLLADARTGGDEPVMMAEACPDAVVAVCEDRVAAARKIVQEQEVDILVLDDAFQHRRIHRDLNILVIHAGTGFGNGSPLPGGPLREFQWGLKRADMVMLSHFDENHLSKKAMKWISAFNAVLVTARHRPSGWRDEGSVSGLSRLSGKKAVAFTGIARPDSFFTTLEAANIRIVKKCAYKDHHVYTKKEMQSIEAFALSHGADILVTTEKDYVKLKPFLPLKRPCFALSVELEIVSGHDVLAESVLELYQKEESAGLPTV